MMPLEDGGADLRRDGTRASGGLWSDTCVCVAARRAPAIVQAGYLQTYVGGGAWFPVGGGQVLSARLADVVLANGGTVAVDSPVAEILVDHAAVQGVRLADGTTAHAPVVVSSADLKKTFRELVGPEHLTSREIRRVDGYRMAWPLFNVYIGLDCDLSARFTSAQHWRFRFDGDFGESQKALDFAQFGGDREAWLEACRTYLGGMIHIATAKDPVSGLAPPGMSSIEVMTYVPPDPELWGIDGYDPTVSSSYRASEVYRYMKQQVTEILVDVASDVIRTSATTSSGSRAALPQRSRGTRDPLVEDRTE